MKKQILFLSAGRIIGTAIQAVTIVLVARATPVDRFGILSAVLGGAAVATAFSDLGLTTLLARARAAGDAGLQMGCIRLNRLTTLLSSVCCGLLLVAIADSRVDALAFGALAVALCLEKNTECLLSMPVADGRQLVPSISLLLRRSSTFVITLLFGVLGNNDWLMGFCLGMLAGSILGQVQVTLVVHRQLVNVPGCPQRTSSVLRAAAPFFVSNFSAQSRLLDVSLIALTAGPMAAGFYGAANRIVQPFTLIPNVISAVLLPKAVKSTKSDCRALMQTLMWATLLLLLLTGTVALCAESVVPLVLGPAYGRSSDVLAVLLLGLPFISLSPSLGSLLQASGDENFVGWNGLTFAILALAAAASGGILAGALGGATGVGFAYAFKCIFLKVRLNRVLREEDSPTLIERSEQSVGKGDQL